MKKQHVRNSAMDVETDEISLEDFKAFLRFILKQRPDDLPPYPKRRPTKAEMEQKFRLVEIEPLDGERRWAMVEVEEDADGGE